MKYHIEHHARTYGITFRTDDSEYDCGGFSTFDEAFAYAEVEIDKRQQAVSATIWDGNTDEVYATCWWDDESVPEENYSDWDYNEDEGFDPYLGELTFDC